METFLARQASAVKATGGTRNLTAYRKGVHRPMGEPAARNGSCANSRYQTRKPS